MDCLLQTAGVLVIINLCVCVLVIFYAQGVLFGSFFSGMCHCDPGTLSLYKT